MQQRAFLVVLAFLAPQVVSAAPPASFLEASTEASAETQAKIFLANHVDTPVEQDELVELKRQNPDAYAVVKALLTKRSLGLLNSKNPTASFAPVSEAHKQATQVALPDASRQPAQRDWINWKPRHTHIDSKTGLLSTESQPLAPKAARMTPASVRSAWMGWMQHHDDDETAKPEGRSNTGLLSMESPSPPSKATSVASASVHHARNDWINWRRHDDNDDEMVRNVLGAVVEPKGGIKTGLLSMEDEAASDTYASKIEDKRRQDEDKMNWKRQQELVQTVLNDHSKEVATTPAQKSHLRARTPAAGRPAKGPHLTAHMAQAAARAKTTKRTSQVQASSANYLASFSWQDKPKLDAWFAVTDSLGTSSSATARKTTPPKGAPAQSARPMKAAPADSAKPSNRYLVDLS